MIWVWPDAALLILNGAEAARHSHYAYELYLGLTSDFRMDFGAGFRTYRHLAVNSGCPHRFSGAGGIHALLLIHPHHPRAGQLADRILKGRGHAGLDPESFGKPLETLIRQAWPKMTLKTASALSEDILAGLTLQGAARKGKDPRIERAESFIRIAFEEPIRLLDLAQAAHLSESRFRHLFKQETGISIRQYILGTRTVEAVKLIIRGKSKTDAAHEAGFSDAAHLSRTFRNMYGLTLTDIFSARTM